MGITFIIDSSNFCQFYWLFPKERFLWPLALWGNIYIIYIIINPGPAEPGYVLFIKTV